jgi:hypothetical protein
MTQPFTGACCLECGSGAEMVIFFTGHGASMPKPARRAGRGCVGGEIYCVGGGEIHTFPYCSPGRITLNWELHKSLLLMAGTGFLSGHQLLGTLVPRKDAPPRP